MKKTILIIILLFTIKNGNLFSQQWPANGAEFTYCIGDIWIEMTASKIKIHYSHDTLISGKIYQISKDTNQTPYTEINHTYFTRYSNDTVYRWVNDDEYLFFHFKLQLNEVFTTFRSIAGTSDTACSSLLPLKVIDSTTTTINGEEVIRWVLKDTLGFSLPGSEYTDYKEYVLYEKYGFVEFPWLFNPWESLGCTWMSDIGFSYLGGYNDPFTDEWVDHCPMANISENKSIDFKTYPNPIQDFFTIEFTESQNEPFQIQVFDVTGKLILENNYEKSTQKVELNCQNLNEGMYFYTITQNNGVNLGSGKFVSLKK